MTTLWQDIRYGIRMLGRYPGFTAVAVLTLALAIGANTAIFTLIDALLLKSLPGVKDPQQLVLVTDRGSYSHPYVLYDRLHDRSESFSGLFSVGWPERRRVGVLGQNAAQAEPVQAQAVSGNFFDVLGVPAALGRTLTPNDDLPGEPQAVVVLSHSFWQRRFTLDPAVIGTAITLNDIPFTIVGVAPREFSGFSVERRPDLWWPIRMIPQVDGAGWAENFTNPTAGWVQIGGRLKAGTAPAQVRSELDVIFMQMIRELVPQERTISHLAGFFSLSALALACLGLYGILSYNVVRRTREMGIRMALGAQRRNGICVVLRQGMTLTLLGCAAGTLLAIILTRVVSSLLYGVTPTDPVTFILTALLLSAVAFVSCWLPARRAARIDPMAALRYE